MKFTVNDIKDKELLLKMINEEARSLFNSPKARNGRTIEEIQKSVIQGKIAEMYLIETGEYFPANKKYHDLRDASGALTEVKSYNVYDKNAPHVIKDLERIRTGGWNESKYYMLFKCVDGEYELLEKITI